MVSYGSHHVRIVVIIEDLPTTIAECSVIWTSDVGIQFAIFGQVALRLELERVVENGWVVHEGPDYGECKVK